MANNIFEALANAGSAGLGFVGENYLPFKQQQKQNALTGFQVARTEEEHQMNMALNKLKLDESNLKMKELVKTMSMTPEQRAIEGTKSQLAAFNYAINNIDFSSLDKVPDNFTLNTPIGTRQAEKPIPPEQPNAYNSFTYKDRKLIESIGWDAYIDMEKSKGNKVKTLSATDQEKKNYYFKTYPKDLATSLWLDELEGIDSEKESFSKYKSLVGTYGEKGPFGGKAPTPELRAEAAGESGYSPIYGSTLNNYLRVVYDKKANNEEPPEGFPSWDKVISDAKNHFKNLKSNVLNYYTENTDEL